MSSFNSGGLVPGGGASSSDTGDGTVTSVSNVDGTIVVTGTPTVAPVVSRAAITGDSTIAAGSNTSVLKNTGPGATGPLGSATTAPIVTIDAQGRVTGLTSATIAQTLGLTQINGTTSGAIAAVVGDIVNTTAAATVTLPATPSIGQCVLVNRGNHTALITINANAGQTINGAASCSMATSGALANRGQALFIAQSATAWSAIALGDDLGFGLDIGGNLTVNGSTTANNNVQFASGWNIHNLLKTANYATVAGDIWIRGTGSWTLTLTTNSNKLVFVTNEGTGIITVVSSSGSVIGATSIPAGGSAIYVSNGTNWDTLASSGFNNTAAGAVATTPTLGAAAQLANTTVDQMLYIDVATTATNLTIAIGPTSGVANSIVTGASVGAGTVYTVRLPAGWFVAVTSTTGTWTTTAITC